jgi:hypothetical protein
MFPYPAINMACAMRAIHGLDRPDHPANIPLTDQEADAIIRRRAASSGRLKSRLALVGSILVLVLVVLAMGGSVVS